MKSSMDGIISRNGNWILTGTMTAGTGMQGGHFRIKRNGICEIQGTFGEHLSNAEMLVKLNMIAIGQQVEIVAFNIKRGNE